MSKQQDAFNSELGKSTDQLKSFKDAVKINTDATLISTAAIKQAKKEDDEQLEKLKKFASGLSGGIAGAVSFGKALSDGKGSFAPLQTVFTAVTKGLAAFAGVFGTAGKIVGAAIKAAGVVANFIVERFDHTYGVFTKLSDSGVVGSFEDLHEGVAATRIGFDQMSTALEKHSKDLALFAGSATKGVNVFKSVAAGSLDLRRQYQKLGVSTEDFADFQLTYLTMEMRTEAGKKKTNDELIKGTSEYIDTLDSMSKLTGMSRKAINDEMADRQKNDAGFRAWATNAPKIQKDNILKMTSIMFGKTGGNKELTQGLSDYIRGNTNTKEAQLLLNTVNDTSALEELKEASKKGGLDYIDKLEKVQLAMGVNAKKQTALVQYQTKDSAVTAAYVSALNASQKTDKSLRTQIEEEMAASTKTKEQTKGLGVSAAETKQNMEQASINIDLLATSSEMTASAMKVFSGAMESVTEKFYEMGGKSLPPILVARKKERLLMEKQIDNNKKFQADQEAFQKEFGDNNKGGARREAMARRLEDQRKEYESITAELADAKKETERLEILQNGRPAGSKLPGGQTTSPSSPTAQSPSEGPGPASGSEKNESLKPDVLAKKAQLESILGKPLVVTSGFRKGAANHGDGSAIDLGFSHNNLSESEINKLFKGAIDVGFTGIGAEFKAKGGAHIHLDTSHSGLVGWGSDEKSASLARESPYLAKLINDKNSGKKSARTGGIFTDPGNMSDDPEENAGNVGQQALNTSTLTGASNGSSKLDDLYDMMSSKMSTLVNLMETSQRNEKDKMKKEFS